MKARDSIIFLTYRCTSQCKTCNIWKWPSAQEKELSWDEWRKILTKLKNYGIKTVELFGGDALLRKDIIFKMIDFCSKNGIKTYFPTNSILLDRETAKNIVVSGLNTLYFSLDDVGLDNDRIRGVNDTFLKVKSALENVAEARKSGNNPKIVICTTISKMNYNHFPKIIAFLKQYPVDAVYPRVLGEFSHDNINNSVVDGIKPDPFFVSTEGESHKLAENELKDFVKVVRTIKNEGSGNPYINLRAFYEKDRNISREEMGNIKKCRICSTLITINPYGDVIPCLFFRDYVLGNLVKGDFKNIWGNEKHKIFVLSQRVNDIKICGECISRAYYPSFWESIIYYKTRLFEKITGNHWN